MIIGHGQVDHYGTLPSLARGLQGQMQPGLSLYAGGGDTFSGYNLVRLCTLRAERLISR